MKSILYVGATLMIGASVYGFVDYKQTSHKKEFSDMYAEEKRSVPDVNIPVVKKEDPAPAKTEASNNKTVTRKTKTVSKKADTPREETVPAIKPIAAEDKLASEKKNIEKATVDVTPSKESAVVKKARKRISSKMFSRGAMDDRYIDREETPKKDSKKAENKEQ